MFGDAVVCEGQRGGWSAERWFVRSCEVDVRQGGGL